MGTVSLVFGISLIVIGFATMGGTLLESNVTAQQIDNMRFNLILGVLSLVVGGLLLRKYDKERKKE